MNVNVTYCPQLVRFLKAWKIWELFKSNCENCEWDNNGYYVHSVWVGFPWPSTKEGLKFWDAVNEMYCITLQS